MKNLTCIVCPIGCALEVEEGPLGADGFAELSVSGNRCPRGAAYAREEIRAPKRTLTATCGIAGTPSDRSLTVPRRIPVKSSAPCPREKIPELLAEIYRTRVSLPVKTGDKVISNWQGSGIDVVAARDLD